MPGPQSFHCREALLGSRWVDGVRIEIDDRGFIQELTPNVAPTTSDWRLGTVVPGMTNLHSHAFQRAWAGTCEKRGGAGRSFWTWRDAMYRWVERLTPVELGIIARWVYEELLVHGYTTVGEFHYLHHGQDGAPYQPLRLLSQVMVSAAQQTGIRLTHFPTLYSWGGFQRESLVGGQRRFANDVEVLLAMARELASEQVSTGSVKIGVAAHSLRAVESTQLTTLAEKWLTDGNAQPCHANRLHVHVAEQRAEVETCQRVRGIRPVEWLLNHHPVDHRWCLIHATHVDSAEVKALASSRATVGLCPTTEANLGDGIFPASSFMELGGRFGIGSDSHISVCPFDELRMLEYGQRLLHEERNVLATEKIDTATWLYSQSAANGAWALDQATGEIRPGLSGDWVELDDGHPLCAGRRGGELLSTHVFVPSTTAVRSVFVRGVQRVAEGQFLGDSVAEEMQAIVDVDSSSESRQNPPKGKPT